ncbi:hypothetical protein RHGRI_000139 [Rhododendron griersonianum]|uniref:5'-deoxynucleotidase n=1 Tax=Rhododendron griersonianum TaxID=479676 RepID=A0AAV6LGA3_9ERIC|nr:hypothetical protein RHGRI_000139 [Rhododendron griersonianum]
MGSGSRALLCKSFVPSLASSSSSTRLFPFSFFKSRTSSSTTTARVSGMASDPPPPSSPPPPSAPADGGDASSVPASSAIDFLSLCHRLKTTKRAGWVLREVRNPESIADHMYRMGLMALIASDLPGVDRDKLGFLLLLCIKMAIVHDIAEAIVGDITPSDGVPKQEKSRLEREAIDYMSKLLGGGQRAEEIGQLWTEYEENLSLEAKVVKDFDKVCGMLCISVHFVVDKADKLNLVIPYPFQVEMILQALEYETEQGKNLEEFFQSTAGKFQTELGKAWASEIASRRTQS